MQDDVTKMSFDELAQWLRRPPRTHEHLAAKAELDIRRIGALLEATEAQKAAAKAEEKAAAAEQKAAEARLACSERTQHEGMPITCWLL